MLWISSFLQGIKLYIFSKHIADLLINAFVNFFFFFFFFFFFCSCLMLSACCDLRQLTEMSHYYIQCLPLRIVLSARTWKGFVFDVSIMAGKSEFWLVLFRAVASFGDLGSISRSHQWQKGETEKWYCLCKVIELRLYDCGIHWFVSVRAHVWLWYLYSRASNCFWTKQTPQYCPLLFLLRPLKSFIIVILPNHSWGFR